MITLFWGIISSACPSLSLSASGTFSKSCLQPFLSDATGRHCPLGWEDCESALWLAIVSLGSRVGNIFCLRIQIRHICTLLSSQVGVCPRHGTIDEQRWWLKVPLGLYRYGLNKPKSGCWLLHTTPLFLITVIFPVVESHRLPCDPWMPHQSRDSHRVTHMLV